MTELPTGTATFMFTDIEGSTRLVEELGSDYGALLARHDELIRIACAGGGAEVGTEGDSFFAVFGTAGDAVAAAIRVQRAMAAEPWARGADVKVRIGIHTGEAELAAGVYVGIDVHRAARIMSAAHGGQILASEATRGLVSRAMPAGASLRDLGEHRLKDLPAPERLYQVTAESLEAAFPPPRTIDSTPNNLPITTSALVGRAAELEQLARLLRGDAVRLVTLTGPGGIGKTRLAVQAASDALDHYDDGVFFVDLAHAREPTAVLVAIAQTTGLTVPGDRDLREALAAHLRPRRLLLVLDNFEQVMAAADDAAELSRQCPRLALLVTSREALRVRGEQLLPVPPLSLPTGSAGAMGSSAVTLFVERGREARPSFGLDDETAAVVGEICARLDGLPLAIELAAARLRLFSPAELRDRLQGGLDVLGSGARDLPDRQRTLRDTIAWSYDLLDPDERALFKVLAVFPSAQVKDVEEVCTGIDALAGVNVVDGLGSLVDKSLLRTAESGERQRLSMLETIHEYARDELERDGDLASAARGAHAEHFSSVAIRLNERMRGRQRAAAIDELADELDNVLGAWRFYVESGDLARVKSMLDPLWTLYDTHGWYHAAIGITKDLLHLIKSGDEAAKSSDKAIALRLTLARLLLAVEGYTTRVEDLYRDTLEVASAAGGLPHQVPVLRSLASFHLQVGHMDEVASIGRDILAIADAEGDEGMRIEGLVILAPPTAFMGDLAGGIAGFDRAIGLFDPDRHGQGALRVGPNPIVVAHSVGALFLWMSGFPDTAQRRSAASIALAERLDHPYSLAYAVFHAAMLDLWSGRIDSASEQARRVVRIATEREYPIWHACGLIVEGVTVAAQGEPDQGIELTDRGLGLYQDLRTPPIFWPQVLGLRAQALAHAGRVADALDAVTEAMRVAGPDATFDLIGLLLAQADLQLASGDRAAAEASLEDGLAKARSIGARTPELVAAVRLSQLDAESEDRRAAARAVYDTLTEGFETPALRDARAWVTDAASPVP
jgi:predicted ATPase/class 3 adenylate cyclase